MVFLKEFFKDWRVVAVIIVIITVWLLASCSKPDNATPRLRLYTASAGQHDFTPSPLPLPGEARTLEGTAKFMPSCWYDNLGEDQSDWNKLAGVYRWADVVKNKNSFILAWRPDPMRNVFQLCLYENIDGANRPHESAIYKVAANAVFSFWLQESSGKYALWVNGNFLDDQDNDRQFKTIGKISAWFGGNRTAPHDMSLQMDF